MRVNSRGDLHYDIFNYNNAVLYVRYDIDECIVSAFRKQKMKRKGKTRRQIIPIPRQLEIFNAAGVVREINPALIDAARTP